MEKKGPESRSGADRRKGWGRRSRLDRRKNKEQIFFPDRRKKNDRRDVQRRQLDDRRQIMWIPPNLKIRTVYFKVNDMEKAKIFYSEFFGVAPRKEGNVWCEFFVGNINFGLRLNDFHDSWQGCNFVPVFEFTDSEALNYIQRAKSLGGVIVLDALHDQQMRSVVVKDPFGNEFEISRFHD